MTESGSNQATIGTKTCEKWYIKKKHSKTALQFILQHTVHYVKVFISAVSDLLGFFFQCQNQITKTGGLWL
jgi:hypothetical protein